LKHLNDLTNAQKTFEERQFSFEARIEKKFETFLEDHKSRTQGRIRSTQSQNEDPIRRFRDANQWQNLEPARSARSIPDIIRRQYQEPAQVVYDFDDFEEFDRNFPKEEKADVEELEYNTRKNLELKFELVKPFFVISICFVSVTFL